MMTETKRIRVSWKYFSWIFGYGLWGLATFGIMLVLIASTLEVQSIYEVTGDDYMCDYRYIKIFEDGYGTCMDVFDYKDMSSPLHERHFLSIILVLVDVTGIGLWVYHKQKYFKFEWSCFDD